ncbi:MAG: hypothetical protein ACXACT_18275 [Candidatus Thorarchaeota archaeon]|jgi:hypothetical protein
MDRVVELFVLRFEKLADGSVIRTNPILVREVQANLVHLFKDRDVIDVSVSLLEKEN